MALQMRVRKRNINNWLLTIASVFAFMVAPFYGIVAEQVASAAPAGPEIIKVDRYLRSDRKLLFVDTKFKNYDNLEEFRVQLWQTGATEHLAEVYATEDLLGRINSSVESEQNKSTSFQLPINSRTSSSWHYDGHEFSRSAAPDFVRVILRDSTGSTTEDWPITEANLTNAGETYWSLLPGPVYRTLADGTTPAEYFDTIQEALDDPETVDGSKVVVASGVYQENIELKRKVTLVGNGATINGGSERYTVFINKNAVTGSEISGFTLEGSTSAVLKIGTGASLSGLKIHNNVFNSGSAHLIYAGNVSDSHFDSNTFNLVAGTKGGYFEGTSTGNTFKGNTFKSNTFTGRADSLVLGIENGIGNDFDSNNLNGLATAYFKIFEVKGSNNQESGTTYNPNQLAVAINPGSGNFRGIYSNLPSAVDASFDNDDIALSTSTSLVKPLVLSKKGQTIRGDLVNSSVIISARNWQDPSSLNRMIEIAANGVTLKKLYINGSATKDIEVSGNSHPGLHGVQVTQATDVSLKGVTIENTGRSGLSIWNSNVNVDSINTINNRWHGINVDKNSHLTITGISRHTESAGIPHIYLDEMTSNSVSGDTVQYSSVDNYLKAGDRAYFLASEIPVAPQIKGFTQNSSDRTVVSLQSGDTTNTNGKSPNTTHMVWNNTDYDASSVQAIRFSYKAPGSNTFKNSSVVKRSEQPQNFNTAWVGGVFSKLGQGEYEFRMQVQGTNGLWSDWSDVVTLSYDSTAPSTPELLSPENGAVIKGQNVTQSWSESSSEDIDHYIYQSFNDEGATKLRWQEKFTGTSKTAKNVSDTVYWWRVAAVDRVGNQSGWSELWKVTVDSVAPTIEVNGSTSLPSSFKAGDKFNVRVFDINLDRTVIERIDDAARPSDYWKKTDRSFGLDWLKDGKYKMVAYDKAGNKTEEYVFTVDKTKPTVSIVLDSDINPTVANIIADDSNLNRIDVSLRTNGDTTVVAFPGEWIINPGPFNKDYASLLDLANLPEGKYTIRATASDKVGNSTNAVSVGFEVKRAPEVNGDYFRFKGDHLSVGFTPNRFTDASSATVTIYDEDGEIASQALDSALVESLVNGQNNQISSPFYLNGDVDEAWNGTGVDWTQVARPSYAVVRIAYGNGEVESDQINFIGSDDLTGETYSDAIAFLNSQKPTPTTPKDETNNDPVKEPIVPAGGNPGITSPQSLISPLLGNPGGAAQGASDVLGAQDSNSTEGDSDDADKLAVADDTKAAGDQDVKGAEDSNTGSDCAKILGVCWYWVVVPSAVVVAGVSWWLFGRRLDEEAL